MGVLGWGKEKNTHRRNTIKPIRNKETMEDWRGASRKVEFRGSQRKGGAVGTM